MLIHRAEKRQKWFLLRHWWIIYQFKTTSNISDFGLPNKKGSTLPLLANLGKLIHFFFSKFQFWPYYWKIHQFFLEISIFGSWARKLGLLHAPEILPLKMNSFAMRRWRHHDDFTVNHFFELFTHMFIFVKSQDPIRTFHRLYRSFPDWTYQSFWHQMDHCMAVLLAISTFGLVMHSNLMRQAWKSD